MTINFLSYEEYIEQMARSLAITDEQWMFEEVPDDILDTVSLTKIFLESGGVAFGYPPFEKELFHVFHGWLGEDEDKSLKVWMYSCSLLNQLPEDTWEDLREQLNSYVNNTSKYPDKCVWPELPELYLSNWNWEMHRISSDFWSEKRAIKEARMDLLFTEKYPNWLEE